jgi:hypothetical protein
MVDVLITSPFVLTKPESPDNTIVSNSEWNAAKLVGGGSPGQILARDSGSATGASWIDGLAVQRTSDVFNGSATTTPTLASTIVACATNAFVIVQPYILATLAVGTNAVLSIRRNGALVATGNIRADSAFYQPFNFVVSEAPGTYTYDVLVSGTTGAVTNCQVVLTTLRFGKL